MKLLLRRKRKVFVWAGQIRALKSGCSLILISMPSIQNSWTCCTDFAKKFEDKTGRKYSKADEKMYAKICKAGDEEKAIQIAQQKYEQCLRGGKKKPSNMCPCTTVHLLVSEIKGKL